MAPDLQSIACRFESQLPRC